MRGEGESYEKEQQPETLQLGIETGLQWVRFHQGAKTGWSVLEIASLISVYQAVSEWWEVERFRF